jgi:hypothetical protein
MGHDATLWGAQNRPAPLRSRVELPAVADPNPNPLFEVPVSS